MNSRRDLSLSLSYLQDRELELKASLMYVKKDCLEVIELIKKGKLRLEELVNHNYPFEDLEEAF